VKVETQSGSNYASAVRLERPSPYRIPVPKTTVSASGFEVGETVALRFEVMDRSPRFACERPDEIGSTVEEPVTRTLDARPGEDAPNLTLPKRCIEAGRFRGHRALPYTEPGSDRLFVGLSRGSGIEDASLAAVETARLSRYSGGRLVVTVSDHIAGPLRATETLRCWLDYTDGRPVFVFGVPAVAPPGSVELTANPNTGREDSAGLSVYVPRVLGRLCGVGGDRFRWGRTTDGNRLLGVPVDG